jgi:hypothetical protein
MHVIKSFRENIMPPRNALRRLLPKRIFTPNFFSFFFMTSLLRTVLANVPGEPFEIHTNACFSE